MSQRLRNEQLDRVFAALSDSTRRAMLELLMREGEASASELGAPFSISQPAVSRHLKVLEQAGLIERRVEGPFRRFRLRGSALREGWSWLGDYAEFWSRSFDALAAHLEGAGRK